MARLFQAVESYYGEVSRDAVHDLTGLSRLRASALLRALRDEASIPRRRLETAERRAAVRVMLANTPIRRLISRHTRELLRKYAADGVLSTTIADRQVQDCFVEMSGAERGLYEAVEEYVSTIYKRAAKAERSAVGFVMTIYRRRLASSFAALGATLEKRRNDTLESTVALGEDAPDDEALDEVPDIDELCALESQAAAAEEQEEIDGLLRQIAALPPDSKLARLAETLDELTRDGYAQVMVFTQYTDTMVFLRTALRAQGYRLLCFSGRGGESPVGNRDEWRVIDREQVKRRFRDGDADVLLCTDAAAEGLNFQFCGALVNYDMPWNPMRVEQRIGRVDRVGQRHDTIRVVNLHYEETVETAVYSALRDRIGLFEQVVGRLQPILARMPREIADAVLAGRGSPDASNLADRIKRQVSEEEQGGFDIDDALDTDPSMPDRAPSPVTLDDLDRVISDPDLMSPGTEVQPLGPREYSLLAPGMAEPVRVTTEAAYYEENSESVELWSPGNPLFTAPEMLPDDEEPAAAVTLKHILER